MGILLPTMTEAFNKSLLAASGQTDVMITHKTGETFSATTLNKIKGLDGIAVIGGSLERAINLPPDFYGKNSTISALSLVGVDPAVAPELHDYRVTQGRFLKQGDSNVAVISERLADSIGLKLNDTLKLPTTEGVVKLAIVGLMPGRAPSATSRCSSHSLRRRSCSMRRGASTSSKRISRPRTKRKAMPSSTISKHNWGTRTRSAA